MPTILLDFPARRYHATPWGHHVNEGQVEWPPSPWRLLRALISTGYTKLHWNDDGPPTVARALIEKLSGVLPRYQLPKATGAHSRHYMPLAMFKNGREDTTLVFDTWLQIQGGTLSMTWDVALSADEHLMLSQLVGRLGYLGRSESWVIGRLASSEDISDRGDDCVPCSEVPSPGRGWEQIPMMVPLSPTRYEQWRRSAVDAEFGAKISANGDQTGKAGKKRLERRQKLDALYPPDLLGCLQTTTRWLRNAGWRRPPGSEQVFYWRRSDLLQRGVRTVAKQHPPLPTVEAMLLSIATPSRNDHALPSVTRTLPQAELLHRAFASVAGRRGQHSSTLTGCDEEGRPLSGAHDHAHILPLDLDCDGHLEHFVIWAPRRLDAIDQVIVRSVRKTFSKGSNVSLTLSVACGSAS
jgi:CRISPR-associated protein Csb2